MYVHGHIWSFHVLKGLPESMRLAALYVLEKGEEKHLE